MEFVVTIKGWDGKERLECLTLTANVVYEVLNKAVYERRRSQLVQTESKKVFKEFKDEIVETAYKYGFLSYKEHDDLWHDEAIRLIEKWQTEAKRPLYVLLTSTLRGDSLAVQYSFDKHFLDGIAAAINAQADGWGSARVELFDPHIAEWYMPDKYTTRD